MIANTPPGWLERVLLHYLPARDREMISGDLLEEYREARAPRLGSTRANLWYLRQTISFISLWDVVGAPMNTMLRWTCVFTIAASIWLAIMDNILKHTGYIEQTVIALCIAIQGVATLLVHARGARLAARALIAAGAAVITLLGASAVKGVLTASHFEGFVLLVGCALVVQGLLTIPVMLRGANRRQV